MPEGGSVVLLSSVAARVGLANHEAIAAAKAGVTGFGLSAAAASYVGARAALQRRRPRPRPDADDRERSPASDTARQASLETSTRSGRLGEPGGHSDHDLLAARTRPIPGSRDRPSVSTAVSLRFAPLAPPPADLKVGA